jgi:hypothetical protein
MFDRNFSGRQGPATVEDDRTPEQRITHPIVVYGRDRFMSGWGGARGGYSWAGWACRREDVDRAERWVRGRSDMNYVRVGGDRPRGRQVAHVHVYVFDHQGDA